MAGPLSIIASLQATTTPGTPSVRFLCRNVTPG